MTGKKALPNVQSHSSGFTIIEVLFVLAIAGIILLIVFLAIPALSRNARNSQRKQDVATVLQAVSKYELNNSGDFPPNCSFGVNPPCNKSPIPLTLPNGYPLYYPDIKNELTYYKTSLGQIEIHFETSAIPQSAVNSISKIKVYNYQKCDQSAIGAGTDKGAGYNDVVALYSLEGGNSNLKSICQQL